MRECSIEQVIAGFRRGAPPVTLLIGAGCSATAGVPVAGEMLDEMLEEYPDECAPVRPPSYRGCMLELAAAERRGVIRAALARRRLNWAHRCIASLVDAGHVDRILTTNFDPLLVEACARSGEAPSVYDCTAAGDELRPDRLADRAIVYLLGQGTAAVSSDDDAQGLACRWTPLFRGPAAERTWVVAGCGSETEPVLEGLASVVADGHRLFWVAHGDRSPGPAVRELLRSRRSALLLPGYDADAFFLAITRALGCAPTRWLQRPLAELRRMLDGHPELPASDPASASTSELRASARHLVTGLGEDFESSTPAGDEAIAHRILGLVERGRPEAAAAYDEEGVVERPVVAAALASACVANGRSLVAAARRAPADDRDVLVTAAERRFERALALDSELLGARLGLLDAASVRAHRSDWHDLQPVADAMERLRQFTPRAGDEAPWGAALSRFAVELATRSLVTGALPTVRMWDLHNWIEELFGVAARSLEGVVAATTYDVHFQLGALLESHADWLHALSVVPAGPVPELSRVASLYDSAAHHYLLAQPPRVEPLRLDLRIGAVRFSQARLLLRLAGRDPGQISEEVEVAIDEALGHFAESERVGFTLSELYWRWGDAFLVRAGTQDGDSRRESLESARRRLERALELRPGDEAVLDSLLRALVQAADERPHTDEARRLLGAGVRELERAERTLAHCGSALLAAFYALTGDLEQCRMWSREAQLAGNLDVARLGDFLREPPLGIYWRPGVRPVAERLRIFAAG